MSPPLRLALWRDALGSVDRYGLECGHVYTEHEGPRVELLKKCYACAEGKGWHADLESRVEAGESKRRRR